MKSASTAPCAKLWRILSISRAKCTNIIDGDRNHDKNFGPYTITFGVQVSTGVISSFWQWGKRHIINHFRKKLTFSIKTNLIENLQEL